MNKGIISLCLVAVMAIGGVSALACGQSGHLNSTKWKLVEINGQKIDETRAGLEFSEDGKNFSGNAGCNRVFGGVSIDDTSIKFSAIGTTRIYCEGLMATEAKVVNALRSVDRFTTHADELILFSGQEAVLKFTREDAGGDEVPEPQKYRLEDRRWMLEYIKDEKIGELKEAAFLVFDNEKGSAGGNTSCNVFGGSYETGDGNSIRIFDTVSTMRACIEDNRMEIERGFLGSLLEADRYEINSNELILFRGTEVLLRFRGTIKE